MKRFLLIAIFALCWREVSAQILYVPTGEYSSIQSAIDDANDNDVIIVAEGTYYENINFLGKAITVRSVEPNDPNIVSTTIIDGSCPADPNIASVVTFVNGEDSNSVLTGFTIQNGAGQTDHTVDWRLWDGDNGDGGGVLCSNASPAITKNIFKNCRAEYGGGGIFCHNNASPLITDNTFLNNYAGWYGGAIFARLKCSPMISDNVFRENQCLYLGGAIYLADQCYSKVTNNWIEANSSRDLSGGAIYYFVNSAPTIACNFFVANSSKVTGSAIMVSGAAAGLVMNNVFTGNQLTQASGYGAALGIYANPTLSNNIIADNAGNGIYVGAEANPTIHNNDVWNNALDNYAGYVTDQTGINGNISTDPLLGALLPEPFTVYELEPNSPCRDAGNNADLPAWLAADHDGTDRIVNGVVDIGAQEFRAIAVPQDFDTIQEAINAAQSGDEIVVSQGFYRENLDFSGRNFTLRSLNPLDANEVAGTIIDGNEAASCITLASGEDKSSIIAGFTIQNGCGEFGGGIYIADNCGATILYNTICDNTADRYGGGIDTRHYTDTVIENNRILNNYGDDAGGGIHVGAYADCKIFKNYIALNQTRYARQGGGIYCYNYANVEIVQNEICENWTSSGGAMYGWKSNGSIDKNYIWGNHATAVGGGIALHGCLMRISNNIIAGNVTEKRGGGIFMVQDDSLVVNNTIVENASLSSSGSGIALEYNSYPAISNNILCNNNGGFGVHAYPDEPEYLCEPNLFSNDVWANEAGNYGGSLTEQTGINGNISAEPCFVDPGCWADANDPNIPVEPNDPNAIWIHGDYRIGYFSLCRDAGTSDNAPETDFDESPRPHFAAFDIGAYELQIYDLSATGTVDFTDLLILTNSWLDEGPSIPVDLDVNGIVDFRDFALLAGDWML